LEDKEIDFLEDGMAGDNEWNSLGGDGK